MKKQWHFLLKAFAICGNILFILWPTYNAINGIHENMKATLPEKISYLTLMGLLVINIFLLSAGKRGSRQKNHYVKEG